MKRFSVKLFIIATLLHIVATIAWMSFALSASFTELDAEKHGLPAFPLSLTLLSWILVPVPRLLSYYFHFGPARYFYYLMLPWSFCIGAFFGFLLPRLSRWDNKSPN
jgi:hypothetical protein